MTAARRWWLEGAWKVRRKDGVVAGLSRRARGTGERSSSRMPWMGGEADDPFHS